MPRATSVLPTSVFSRYHRPAIAAGGVDGRPLTQAIESLLTDSARIASRRCSRTLNAVRRLASGPVSAIASAYSLSMC
jgi:hypothetical protein